MYKLVAIDLDGTMLNQYGVVTQPTKEAILRAQEKGIEVMIASGRPIDSVKTIAKDIKSEKYFVSGNGAIIYDIQNNEIIYENPVSFNKNSPLFVRQILSFIKKDAKCIISIFHLFH